MVSGPPFHAFGLAHLTVIAITVASPLVLAAVVKRSRWPGIERVIAWALSGLLMANYLTYFLFVRKFNPAAWTETLPLHLCDWATLVVVITMLTGSERCFEVAYFWGIGGTLQAIVTPNLPFGFPDLRFISFFLAHSGIIVGIVFMMLVRKYRPYPMSIVRAFLWTELYFLFTYLYDRLTGANFGFFLHKPAAFSLLSLLSDSHPVYLLQMHCLALIFFSALYLPFAIFDLARRTRVR